MRTPFVVFAVVVGTTPASLALAAQDQPNLSRRESAMTAKVDDIDTFSRAVSFRTAEGLLSEVHVRALFEGLKPGESVEITYTKARAISVEPAR